MAKFNPPVSPTQDPNYLSYSRPIDVPESIAPKGVAANQILPKGIQYAGVTHADQSGEYAGKAAGIAKSGLGDIIKDSISVGDLALKAGEGVLKENIHQGVYEGASAIREDYIQGLLHTFQALQTGAKIDAATSGQAYDTLTQPPSEDRPEELENLPHIAAGIKGARANGKVSSTDYAGRLDTLAKDFRSRYPGYKSYIDDEFKKVTGQDPANMRARSLVQDINAAVGAQVSAGKKAEAFLAPFADNHPQITPLVALAKAGKMSWEEATAKSMPFIQELAKFNYNKKALDDAELTDKRDAKNAGIVMSERATGLGVASFNALTAQAGAAAGKPFSEIFKGEGTLVTSKNEKGETVTTRVHPGAAEWPMFDQAVAADRVAVINRLSAEFDEVPTEGKWAGKSLASRAGGAEAKAKALKEGTAWHDEARATIALKNPGMANYIKNITEGQGIDTAHAVLGGPKGAELAVVHGFNVIGGNNLAASMLDWIYRAKNITDNDKMSMATQALQFVAQPPIDPRFPAAASGSNPKGVPVTLKQTVEKAAEISGGDPNYMEKIIAFPQVILSNSTNTEEKYKVARGTFDPRNRGLVGLFDREKIDPKTGEELPGQYKVYGDLFSPAMTAEIKKLSDKHDPQGKLWRDYKDQAKGEFGMTLFRGDLGQLKNVSLPDNLKLTWNTEHNNFSILNSRGVDVLEHRTGEVNPWTRRIFQRLNGGLDSLSHVAKAEGSDVNVFLLKTMRAFRYDFRAGAPLNVPESILKALLASEQKDKTEGN